MNTKSFAPPDAERLRSVAEQQPYQMRNVQINVRDSTRSVQPCSASCMTVARLLFSPGAAAQVAADAESCYKIKHPVYFSK